MSIQIKCAHTKMVSMTELAQKRNHKNTNYHSPEQIEELCEQFKFQGVRHPIIISTRDDLFVAGDGRFQAAEKLGMAEFPVDYQDWDTEEKQFVFGVADNEIQKWSITNLALIHKELPLLAPFDLSRLAIPNFELEPNPEDQGDPDAAPEVPKEAKVRPGDAYRLGVHRILCGDATKREDVDRLMAGEKADMVFTSPPYSDLRDYGGNLDLSISKLGGIFDWPSRLFFINLGLIFRKRQIVRYWDDWLDEAEKRNLPLLSWNVWDKGHASAPAHQQAMFGLSHEWVFVFGEYKPLNLTNPNETSGILGPQWGTQREKDGSLSIREKRPKIRDFRQLDSVIRMDAVNCRAAEYSGHPASFPVAFPENHILAAISANDLVCDPFLGSGSTLIACHKTNRRCFGMEIDPLYCDVILTRFAKFSGIDPVREDGVKWSEINSVLE